MARILMSWERKLKAAQRKADEIDQQKRKRLFIEKWLQISPAEQGEIVFDILDKLEKVDRKAHNAMLDNQII